MGEGMRAESCGIRNGAEENAGRQSAAREKEFLFWLCQSAWLGAVSIRKIGEAAGGFEKAYYMEGKELQERGIFRTQETAERFNAWKKEWNRQREQYFRLAERGIWFLTPLDSEYPKGLLHIYDYPMGLYVRGRLPAGERPAVSIVGARACSSYGARTARKIAEELAAAGVQVISGMALGIDGEAHQGAMDGEARPLPCWAAEWISAIPDPIIPLWDGFWNGEAYSPSTRRDSSLWQDIFPCGTGLSADFGCHSGDGGKGKKRLSDHRGGRA